jgi:Zn-dependent protease with chaperone function
VGEIAVRQAILHGLIAAGLVDAALRAWRVRRARSRIAFYLLALAFPFLVLPAFLIAAPFRGTDAFTAGWALFSSDRWNAVRVAGAGADTIAFGALALAGTLLLLRDVVPLLVETARDRAGGGRRQARDRRRGGAACVPPPDALVALVAEIAGRAATPVPAITVLRTDASVMFVRGVFHPTLVLSDGVLSRLSDREGVAAVAHELAHIRFRDPLAGWLLMAARVLMFWNPAVQLVGRAIVEEMEHRADQVAAHLAGASAFATALRTLAPGSEHEGLSSDHRSPARVGLASRLHRAQMRHRLAALTEAQPALPLMRTRFALVAATLTAILFFVV